MATDNFVIGAKRMAADMICLSLKELQAPRKRGVNHPESLQQARREEAYKWFQERSDKPFGYLWCLSLCEQNGAMIRRAVNYLYHENGKLERLKYMNL